LVGGAPVSGALIRWFGALGINLTEIYGQTECAGLAAAMPGDAARRGASGKPVPYGEVAVAEDGEILVRGPHVFSGYWSRPDESARALQDGWLRTSDIGAVADGYLHVAGRRQDVMRLGSGQPVVAAEIEKELRVSPYIADALLFGEGRTFLSCVVVIDHDAVERWAQANRVPFTGFATLVRAEAVRALIGWEIEHALARLGRPGAIGAFRLIEHKLEREDPELTPLMQLRRGVVGETHSRLIEDMYGGVLTA
jgi:long-chain acyl-CoA synthetase